MAHDPAKEEALAWVLAKLAAPKAPVFKPPALVVPKPKAPSAPAVLAPKKPELSETQKQERREHEHDLWLKYNAAKSPQEKKDAFQALLKKQSNIINLHLNRFKGVEVNKNAQKSVVIEKYRSALDSYNPSKGASLATWVNGNLRGLKRYVVGLQNAVRITEPTSELITPYKTAVTELTNKLGYEPTAKQVVEYTHAKDWSGRKLSERDILEVTSIKRSYDLSAGGEEAEGAGLHYNDPYLQAAHVIYHQLKPHEQKVHELMFPKDPNKKPVLKSGTLANKLGWHVSKISKAKSSILNLIQQHVGE